MAWGEEPVKNSLRLIPLLGLETRAEEPAAALSITQVAAFICKQTEFNPIGPDQQLTKLERFSVDSIQHRIRPPEQAV